MKEYKKPVIISQKSYEASALACIKIQPDEEGHLGTGSSYISGTGNIGTGTFHVNPGYTSTTVSCSVLMNVS